MWREICAFIFGAALAGVVAWRLSVSWARRQSANQRILLRRTRQAEKLAELGALAGHLAHEIRNPLSTVKINLQLLSEEISGLARRMKNFGDGGADAAADLVQRYERQLRKIETISKETDRLADTLNDFLRYAGRMELHRVRCDVNEILDDLIDFFRPQALSKQVQIRQSLSKEPVMCRVDGDLLKQAFLNLFINAAQAMEGNGSGEIIVRSAIKAGQAEIEVIDTGPGISAKEQEKIFNAYYTTRAGGSGLGLPTCRRIIEEHDGRIELDSEPGKGTRFTIVLPLVKQ